MTALPAPDRNLQRTWYIEDDNRPTPPELQRLVGRILLHISMVYIKSVVLIYS